MLQVSIFALSNRVLLPTVRAVKFSRLVCFNIRSVESCTAAYGLEDSQRSAVKCFNIRSVESCTAAQSVTSITYVDSNVSIFALSNRVLLPATVYAVPNADSLFQYSLCRIVYCCPAKVNAILAALRGFNIRSVESCTAAGEALPDETTVAYGFNIRSVESCTAARHSPPCQSHY